MGLINYNEYIKNMSLEELVKFEKTLLQDIDKVKLEVTKRMRTVYNGDATEKQLSFMQGLLWEHGYTYNFNVHPTQLDCHCVISRLYNGETSKELTQYFNAICRKVDN